MAREGKSELLDDVGVLAKLREIWPEVNGWVGRAAVNWLPEAGSELDADDDLTNVQASYVARTSLSIGSEAMMMGCTWLNNHGPTVFATRALLRTAVVGGAQAVWTLSPDDRDERIRRVEAVLRESLTRHEEWLKDAETLGSESLGTTYVPAIREGLSAIADRLGPGPRARMTGMVREAAAFVYRDDWTVQAALVEWRSASGLAHALPWDLNTRAHNQSTTELANGRRVVSTRATLADHQAALSLSYALLETGWRLLEQRGQAS